MNTEYSNEIVMCAECQKTLPYEDAYWLCDKMHILCPACYAAVGVRRKQDTNLKKFKVDWTERRAISYMTEVSAKDACEALRKIRENIDEVRTSVTEIEEDDLIDICIISVEEA